MFIFILFCPSESRADGWFSSGPNFEKMSTAIESGILTADQFLKTYTEDGNVYVGARIDDAVRMLTDGLPMGTRPTYGPGCHTTTFNNAIASAHYYGTSYGMVVELKFISSTPRILIINKNILNDPEFKKLNQKNC